MFANDSSQSQGQGGPAGVAGPSADERALQAIAAKRDAATAAPGEAAAAIEYATYVYAAATQGLYARNALDPKVRVREALPMLTAVEGADDARAEAMVVEAALHDYLGDQEARGLTLQRAEALAPGAQAWAPLLQWHAQRGEDAEVVRMCEAQRARLDYGEALRVALSHCVRMREQSDVADARDFMAKADRAWFDAEMGRLAAEAQAEALQAEQARREAELVAQLEAQRQAQAQAQAPAQSGPVSVTIRNRCRQGVKVFYGDKPKFGSGRYSSMSSNSSTSHSFSSGDMFWIVDESQNGLGSVTVNPGMREIEILESCTGMRTR